MRAKYSGGIGNLLGVPDSRCLLAIHAHPDDESSKGPGTVARYHDQGVRTVLVCCTGGEEGDILNPAMDRPEVRNKLPTIRSEELAAAGKIIGYDEIAMLGYRDSGMPGTPSNSHTDSFAQADEREAVGRLVREIRRARPQVIVTYPDDQEAYPHPDHLRVHDITKPTVEAAADPDAYTDLGEPWRVSKIYYSIWSRARIQAMHEKFLELEMESPFTEWMTRPDQDHRITTKVDTTGYADIRSEALRAHATQIDPNSKLWFGLSNDVLEGIHPHDDYILASSTVDSDESNGDLFSGIDG